MCLLSFKASEERRGRMGLFPPLHIPILRRQFLVNLGRMVEVPGQSGVDFSQRQVRILPDNFFRRSPAPQIVCDEHRHARTRVTFQPGWFAQSSGDVRVIQFNRHSSSVAETGGRVNAAVGHVGASDS